MRRGSATTVLATLVALVALTACSSRAPNRDGWWDEGVHEVDGYWVTAEFPCTPENDEACTTAITAASAALRAREPGAAVTGGVFAAYPVQRGKDANEISIILTGLFQPRFVILDLADGSRRVIGLMCGPEFSATRVDPVLACHENDMSTWRATAG